MSCEYGGDSFSYAGGIVGYGEGRITVTNSKNTNEIKSNAHCVFYERYQGCACSGGIIGYGNSVIKIMNCKNDGKILSSHDFGEHVYAYAGGILGQGMSVDSIVNCYNNGEICSNGEFGYYGVHSYSGGIIGCGSGEIKYCYNTGKITTTGSDCMHSIPYVVAGGIVGEGANGVIFCYNTGNILSSGGYCCNCYSGGIMGTAQRINNCYNIGTVSSQSSYENSILCSGGIAGSMDYNGAIENSYYINTCGGNNLLGNELTSLQMTAEGFVSILNDGFCGLFVRDLPPLVNNGYPLLSMMINCVNTGHISDLTATSVTLYGSVSAEHVSLNKGIEYRKAGESSYAVVNVSGNTHDFSFVLDGLEPNNTYEYRAYAHFPDCDYTAYGDTKTFEISWLNQDTIYINNADMLRWVSEQCNSGITFEGKCIKLMNDIVLPENVPNNMISIGSYPDRPFKGTFDGNGKLIYRPAQHALSRLLWLHVECQPLQCRLGKHHGKWAKLHGRHGGLRKEHLHARLLCQWRHPVCLELLWRFGGLSGARHQLHHFGMLQHLRSDRQ